MRVRKLGSRRWAPIVLAAMFTVACYEERPVTAPEQAAPVSLPGRNLAVSVTCTADVRGPFLSCSGPSSAGRLDGPQFLIVGGQGVYVELANTAPQTQGPRFMFDVTVKNLIPQALGTPDGTSITGVKVFFHTMPTATGGSGDLSITVDNVAGTGTFTNTNQPYYEYDQIIAPGETSASEPWQFTLGSDVTTFAFQVYVSADVPFPNGFVQVTPSPDAVLVGGSTSLSAAVVDVLGRPESGRTVTWLSSDDAIATVSPSGTVMGQAGGVVDITASSDGPEAAGSSRITVIDDTGYDVELRFVTATTQPQLDAFTAAVSRWEAAVTGELTNILLQVPAGTCSGIQPVIDEIVDDLLIVAALDSIDGPGQILGQAGPCFVRTSNTLPVMGIMFFDTADVADLLADGSFDEVILHEMAHVMGLGTIWDNLSLLTTDVNCMLDPHFTGALAIAAFDAVGGTGYTDGAKVPVANTGGGGTRCGHWRESVFDDELMTGYLNGGVANPLSVVTIESFADMGYTVDTNEADAYTLPLARPAGPLMLQTPRLQLADDIWQGPLYEVDSDGRVRRVRPDRQ